MNHQVKREKDFGPHRPLVRERNEMQGQKIRRVAAQLMFGENPRHAAKRLRRNREQDKRPRAFQNAVDAFADKPDARDQMQQP